MKSESRRLLFVSPDKLKVHAELERFPQIAPQDFAVLKGDIKERGVLVPLLAIHQDGDLLLIDGRNRRKAAIELKVESVPVFVIDSNEPVAVALAATLARRKLTKSMIVLTLFEAHPELRKERSGRGKQNQLRLKKIGERSRDVLKQVELPSFSALAARHDVPREYFSKLAGLWESATDAEWREICAGITSGDTEIPAQFCGLRSGWVNKDRKRSPSDWGKLLRRALTGQLAERVKRGWKTMDTVERAELLKDFEQNVQKFPREFCAEIGRVLVERAEDDTK